MSDSGEESDPDRIIELVDLGNSDDEDSDATIDVEEIDEEDEDDDGYWPVAIYSDALSGYNEQRGKRPF